MAYLSPRELVLLAGCRPELAPLVLRAMQGFEDETGHKTFVTQGFRTLAMQTADYADSLANGVQQYRVAKPGTSRHELGAAADIAIVGVPDQRDPLYDTLGAHIMAAGLKWGGEFVSGLPDKYHAELREPYAVAVAKYHAMRATQATVASGGVVALALLVLLLRARQ